MRLPTSVAAALLSIVLGCTTAPGPLSPASSTSTGAGGGTGAGTGTGTGGAEPLPLLDPAACPITADSGADPAIAAAAEAQWSPTYALPKSTSVEQDKAFFLATLLRGDGALLADLAADMALAAVAKDRDQRLRGAPANCVDDVACHRAALTWTDAEAASAADALHGRLASSGKLTSFAKSMPVSRASTGRNSLSPSSWSRATGPKSRMWCSRRRARRAPISRRSASRPG